MKFAPLLIACLLAPPGLQAQSLVESRDQATGWYVPVTFKVTAEGAKAKRVQVRIYRDNELIQEIPKAKSKFTVGLDLDNTYTVVLSKEGFRDKSLFMDTRVPEQRVEYPGYACTLNLEAHDKFRHSDPFYMDFPGAIVRWNDEAKGFLPQLEYLTDIQSKIAMLQAQMTPQ